MAKPDRPAAVATSPSTTKFEVKSKAVTMMRNVMVLATACVIPNRPGIATGSLKADCACADCACGARAVRACGFAGLPGLSSGAKLRRSLGR